MTSFFTTNVVKNFPETRRYATRRSNHFFPKKIHAAHTKILFYHIINIYRKFFISKTRSVFILYSWIFCVFFSYYKKCCTAISYQRRIKSYFQIKYNLIIFLSVNDVGRDWLWKRTSSFTLTALFVSHFDDVSRESHWLY